MEASFVSLDLRYLCNQSLPQTKDLIALYAVKTFFLHIAFLSLWLLWPIESAASGLLFHNVSLTGATTVLCVAQDRQGLIWMGTDAGLFSYDGYRTFPHFTIGQPQNSRVHAIQIVGDRICLGADAGLLVYDMRTASYVDLPQSQARDVRALLADTTRIVLGGNNGLTLLSPNASASEKPTTIALPNVYALLEIGKDDFLVGTIGGLYRFQGGRATKLQIGTEGQPLVNALALVDDRNPSAGCWVGTEGALYRYRQGQFERIAALDGNSIKSIAKADGQLRVGTDDGLYLLSADGRATQLTHDSRLHTSIANNIVWAVEQLPGGIFCAGTDCGLSFSVANRSHQALPLSRITGSGDGNTIHALLHEPDGTLWMGGTNGLIRCTTTASADDLQTSRVAWYRPGSTQHYLPHNRVRKIYRDREGDIVVCTDHGVNVYDRPSERFRNFIVTDKSGTYTTAWAYDVVEDAQGRYWMAAYMGGVFVVSKKKLLSSSGRVVADHHFSSQLQGIHVSQLAMDGQQRVWMRTYENGTDIIDTRTMRVEHRLKGASDFLAQDAGGGIVVAHDGVVERFAASGASRSVIQLSALPSKQVGAVALADDCLWVLTGRVCRVFRADGTSRSLTIPGEQPQSMYYDAALHRMVFGCNDGLMLVSPEGVGATEKSVPGLMLTGIQVNGQPWEADGVGASFAEAISLSSVENNLRLCLSDLPYLSDLQQVYVYRLEGVDRTWQTLSGDDLSISYNALPYGNFRLTVCVADGQGNPGREVYGIDVTVRPPWYLTPWAKILLLVLLAALLLWALNSYMVRERLRKERAERRQMLEQSKARAAFFESLSRQLKSPVGRILASLYALLPDEKDSARRQSINKARRDATLINELVVRQLDIQTTGAAGGQAPAELVRIDVADFCRRTADDLRAVADQRKAELRFKTDTPIIYISLDLVHFSPLLRSLISFAATNALPQGTATCALRTDSQRLTVTIAVSIEGWTLPKERLPFVFYRYGQVAAGNPADSTEGINPLSLLKDFAEQQGGSLTVSTSDEQGTTFTLTLVGCEPLPKRASGEPTAAPEKQLPLSADTADSRLLTKITQVVEAHIADSELNVSRLQELVGLGDKLLYRRVKQMTGRTPVEFIRHIRMQRAAMLLREGKFAVSEVMYMVGFSNSSYFSKCFQKVYGITPAEYQRRAKY